MTELPTLGRRGGGWVALQLVLMAAVVALTVLGPRWPASGSGILAGAGAVLAVGGAVLAAVSVRALGRSLTPLPAPAERGQLVEAGPYGVVRHPIYTGGILFFAGVSLAFSPAALVATAALAVLWALKAQVEERFLVEKYPGYEDYADRIRFRLLPFVY